MGRRTRSITTLLCLSIVLMAHSHPAAAQEEPTDPPALLFILDSSGSMNADDGTGRAKIQSAKKALRGLVTHLPTDVHVGLRVYGHRVPNTDRERGCKDTELIVPVGPLDRRRLTSAISVFQAKGFTPIGLSLQEGADDLPPEGDRTIVLVSDGIDTCAPPPPCEVARRLRQQGIDITIETIGFQVNSRARNQLKCIAKATGGLYRDAPDARTLARGLRAISRRTLRTYQVGGEPVVGGAAFREAPLLGPGLYNDTILINESLWYAVQLQERQELVVQATLDRLTKDTGTVFEIQLVAPSLEDLCCGDERGYQVSMMERYVSVTARSGTVGTDDDLTAGTYYIRATCDACVAHGRELPLELGVEVLGAEAPSPSPSPEPTPTSSETPDEQEPADGTDDDPDAAAATDTISGPMAAVIVLLGILVLILGIAVLLLWRRGRSAPSGGGREGGGS